jgi:hypoxanthine-DNA glycosylase
MFCKSFLPIAESDAEVLILGSIPSVKSLEQQEYYGHPRNAFWWIMGELFGFDYTIEYNLRTSQLIKNKIALWDVLKQCERSGSLDSAILAKSIEPNNFSAFFAEHSHIRRVFFNGTKAESEFRKRVLPQISANFADMEYQRLPSTSPAMATMTKSAKLAEWQKALCRER